jgi:hypothetical protein
MNILATNPRQEGVTATADGHQLPNLQTFPVIFTNRV